MLVLHCVPDIQSLIWNIHELLDFYVFMLQQNKKQNNKNKNHKLDIDTIKCMQINLQWLRSNEQ